MTPMRRMRRMKRKTRKTRKTRKRYRAALPKGRARSGIPALCTPARLPRLGPALGAPPAKPDCTPAPRRRSRRRARAPTENLLTSRPTQPPAASSPSSARDPESPGVPTEWRRPR
jgi:hypothetical protein